MSVPRTASAALGMALLTVTIVRPPPPILVWNASASMTQGLYLVAPGTRPTLNDSVVVWAPRAARRLAAARDYLPETVPLVKRVAAIEGDVVCADGLDIAINGRIVAQRLAHDAGGRPMPWWSGCHRLADGEAFVLIEECADSFDGRYFGITQSTDIIGRASLLWAR